jgi:hypothetical protein
MIDLDSLYRVRLPGGKPVDLLAKSLMDPQGPTEALGQRIYKVAAPVARRVEGVQNGLLNVMGITPEERSAAKGLMKMAPLGASFLPGVIGHVGQAAAVVQGALWLGKVLMHQTPDSLPSNLIRGSFDRTFRALTAITDPVAQRTAAYVALQNHPGLLAWVQEQMGNEQNGKQTPAQAPVGQAPGRLAPVRR